MKRFAGRLLASYFVLYLLPFPASYIPYTERVETAWQALWQRLLPWVAKRFFKLTITVFPNGSGDTTFNYVQVSCFAVVAVVAASIWTLIVKGAPISERTSNGVRFYVRFGLGAVLMGYGCAKFFDGQFPTPSSSRMLQNFGNSTPMGLLWTFMGASQAYSTFSGILEVVSGLLLFWRRTLLPGAVMSAAVLSNVAMLNLAYDVPVKLYSLHLLMMALYLAAPGVPAMIALLLQPKPRAPLLLKALAGLLAVSIVYADARSTWLRRGTRPVPPLSGAYAVDDLKVALSIARENRWARVGLSSTSILVIAEDGSSRYLELGLDTSNGLMHVTKPEVDGKAPETVALLDYRAIDPDHLQITGKVGGEPASMTLRKLGKEGFPLLTRGFHWINEYPYAR